GLMPGMRLSRGELRAFNPTRARCPDVLFLSNHGRRLRRAQRRFLVQLIQRARERIYIGSAYFIPARSILWLLRRKAKAGLDVRIITAGRSDVWLARQAGRSTYGRLLRAGVRIMEFQDRMYHSKVNIVDQRFMIGSTNMDYRSFLHNLEVDAWVCRDDALQEALDRWNLDEESSRELVWSQWKKRGILEKILEKVAFLLRFYL
ncbi:MAG: hypothetical protein KDK33_10660, partial [Leptospiraceae bacterium]|nr:hypothetical protein [Leptospiraceae bacterium]